MKNTVWKLQAIWTKLKYMPSKIRQLQFRLPWLRQSQGNKADAIAKSILEHPSIKQQVEEGKCPVCGKLFNDCEYFQRLENE